MANSIDPDELKRLKQIDLGWYCSDMSAYRVGTVAHFLSSRCYAALGDVAKARFMKETFRIADEVSKTIGGDGFNSYKVRARLAIMEKKFKEAESIYLEQVRKQVLLFCIM